jgi:hypothetical protein
MRARRRLVSADADGTGGGDADSREGYVSPDGSTVLFTSEAGNLAPGGEDAWSGMFKHVLATGVTTRLTDGASAFSSPSGDTIAVLDDGEVWLRDRASATTSAVSAGLPGDTHDGLVAFSHDGSRVAFKRRLVYPYVTEDIYVHDRDAGTTELVTRAASGGGASDNTSSHVQGFHPPTPTGCCSRAGRRTWCRRSRPRRARTCTCATWRATGRHW